MNILLIGSFCPKHLEGKLNSGSAQLYNHTQLLIKGFKLNTDISLSVITSPDVFAYPKNSFFIKSFYDKDSVYTISSLNIKFINLLWTTWCMYKRAKKIINSIDKTIIVIIPYMVFRHVLVARLLKYRFRDKVIICNIIPDIFFPSIKKNPLKFWINKLTENMARKNDCFVLYTETMADYLKIKEKPCIVMEGLIDDIIVKEEIKKNFPNKKIILYTGSLHKGHGIMRLFKVMEIIDDSNVELWITGIGFLEEEIKKQAEKDSRIKFFGALKKEEVFEKQKQAMVLINPRMSSDAELSTKYMFPSKILEYLLSGNPSIICKLSGIPEEYYQYFFVAEDGYPEALVKSINQVLSMTDKERIEFGERGQRFVLEQKNYYVQSRRIYDLIKRYENNK